MECTSYLAQMFDVTVLGNASSVDRVVIAANRDLVKAQMEGGMGFGLSAALISEVTLEEGRVQQSNFDHYQVLRMNQMSGVEVQILPSAEPPASVGEPSTPVIAPALANALASATGRRLYRPPLKLG